MSNFINTLTIQNYKSIQELTMDCKRINILIGKPNVGKSNILEALGLFTLPYIISQLSGEYINELLRFETVDNLFADRSLSKNIQVTTNLGTALLKQDYSLGSYLFEIKRSDLDPAEEFFLKKHEINPNYVAPISDYSAKIDRNGHIRESEPSFNSPIKYYKFKPLNSKKFKPHSDSTLLPPFGENIASVIERTPQLHEQFNNIFREYGLLLLIKQPENVLEILKMKQDYVGISYPYSTISDTLQRIIFYLTAIETNKDSVLLFEEPESHAFPYYIKAVADRIASNTSNQFFIATHNAVLLNNILENAFDAVAIWSVYYEDHQTKVKLLGKDEVQEIINYDVDPFINFTGIENLNG